VDSSCPPISNLAVKIFPETCEALIPTFLYSIINGLSEAISPHCGAFSCPFCPCFYSPLEIWPLVIEVVKDVLEAESKAVAGSQVEQLGSVVGVVV